ncbi:hypothetical protein KM043_015980 [Ampulex compressa]|nr:hypothetical protein KM043_015980 [Ampulex compressa]
MAMLVAPTRLDPPVGGSREEWGVLRSTTDLSRDSLAPTPLPCALPPLAAMWPSIALPYALPSLQNFTQYHQETKVFHRGEDFKRDPPP